MKYEKPINLREKLGEERFVFKFLFFPKTLNGITKWLVTAMIKQVVTGYYADGKESYQWEDKSWTE